MKKNLLITNNLTMFVFFYLNHEKKEPLRQILQTKNYSKISAIYHELRLLTFT